MLARKKKGSCRTGKLQATRRREVENRETPEWGRQKKQSNAGNINKYV